MSFYPDGRTQIPNQTPVPGMSGPSHAEQQARFRRAIVRTATINGLVLVAAVALAYVFPVSDDPDVALYIVIGAAMLTAVHMTVVVMGDQRRRAAENATQPTSSGPAPASEQPGRPYGAVPPGGGFAMEVQDSFTITGRGTVVTGMVQSGQLSVGDVVTVQRDGQVVTRATVSGIEKLRAMTDIASVGDRVGVLLDGGTRDDVVRGDRLTT